MKISSIRLCIGVVYGVLKTNIQRHVIWFIAVLLFVLISCSRPSSPKTPDSNSTSNSASLETNESLIAQAKITEGNNTNSIANLPSTNANIVTNIFEMFRSMKSKQTSVMLDGSSGRQAKISLNPQSIDITDSNGNVILETNVIEALVSLFEVKTPEELPIVGEKKIGSIQVVNGFLFLNVGKFVVSVDPKNGQIRPVGSD